MIYVMPVVVSIVATWLAGFLWFRVLFRLPSADGLSPFTVSLLQHAGDIGFGDMGRPHPVGCSPPTL